MVAAILPPVVSSQCQPASPRITCWPTAWSFAQSVRTALKSWATPVLVWAKRLDWARNSCDARSSTSALLGGDGKWSTNERDGQQCDGAA